LSLEISPLGWTLSFEPVRLQSRLQSPQPRPRAATAEWRYGIFFAPHRSLCVSSLIFGAVTDDLPDKKLGVVGVTIFVFRGVRFLVQKWWATCKI